MLELGISGTAETFAMEMMSVDGLWKSSPWPVPLWTRQSAVKSSGALDICRCIR